MKNRVFLEGNVGKYGIKTYYSEKGTTVASFSLAFSSGKYKSGDHKTSFIRVVAFRDLGDFVEEKLIEGSRIVVEGTLEESRWETSLGEKRKAYQVTARKIELKDEEPKDAEQEEKDTKEDASNEVNPF